MGAQSLSDALAPLAGSVQTVVYAAGPEGSALHTTGHVALGVFLLAVGSAIVVVVWMVGHALDVLALVCPFPFLDLLLKGFRNAIFVALVATTAINWKSGLAASLALILVSLALVGWAYRLLVFRVRFSWDLLRVLITEWRWVPRPTSRFLPSPPVEWPVSRVELMASCRVTRRELSFSNAAALAWGRGAACGWGARPSTRSERGCSIQASCPPTPTVPSTG